MFCTAFAILGQKSFSFACLEMAMEASSRGGTELGPRVGDQKSVSH